MCRYVLLFSVMVISSDQLQILQSYILLLKPPILGSYIYRKLVVLAYYNGLNVTLYLGHVGGGKVKVH